MKKSNIITLQSNLDMNQCIINLQQIKTNNNEIYQYILGFNIKLHNNKFKISKITQLHNVFRPIFSGTILLENGKTLIYGNFSMMPLVKILVGFALSLITIIALVTWLVMFAVTRAGKGPSSDLWIVIIGLPLICYAFVLLAIFLGRWLARNDKKEIIEHLKELLEVKTN
jgi:hypothetical protein